MNRESLIEVLSQMGLWPLKPSGMNHFKIGCLYQHSRHTTGEDRHPSGTISFDRGMSWFKCHTCGIKRPLFRAMGEVAGEWGRYHWATLATKVEAEEQRQAVLEGEIQNVGQSKKLALRNYTPGLRRLIESGGFDYPDEVVEHLASKGISPEMAKKMMIVFVPKGYVDPYITRDENGMPIPVADDTIVIPTLYDHPKLGLICVGAQGRPLHAVTRKYYTFYSYSSGEHIYGQHWFHLVPGRPLFVVEGQYDVGHIWQEGHCAGGLFGLYINKRRIHLIKQAQPSHIIIFTDPDPEGQKAVGRIVKDMQYEDLTPVVATHDTDPKHCSKAELDSMIP